MLNVEAAIDLWGAACYNLATIRYKGFDEECAGILTAEERQRAV